MISFDEGLKQAVAYHGHLCAGQIIGVRMALLGLKLMEIEDPAAERDLIVYVEADRCIADAVGTITHCKLGRRRLKWMNFGKSAATFLNIRDGKAVRVASKKKFNAPEGADLVEFYKGISDEEIFKTEWVEVDIKPEEMPGRPTVKAECDVCGENVMDNRHVQKDGKNMCRACAGESYYKVKA